ncbi:hypothetical protein ABK040_005867 [Willaertia magna]
MKAKKKKASPSNISTDTTSDKQEEEKEAVQQLLNSSQENATCPTYKEIANDKTMIGCDICNDWYHLDCLKNKEINKKIPFFICPKCQKERNFNNLLKKKKKIVLETEPFLFYEKYSLQNSDYIITRVNNSDQLNKLIYCNVLANQQDERFIKFSKVFIKNYFYTKNFEDYFEPFILCKVTKNNLEKKSKKNVLDKYVKKNNQDYSVIGYFTCNFNENIAIFRQIFIFENERKFGHATKLLNFFFNLTKLIFVNYEIIIEYPNFKMCSLLSSRFEDYVLKEEISFDLETIQEMTKKRKRERKLKKINIQKEDEEESTSSESEKNIEENVEEKKESDKESSSSEGNESDKEEEKETKRKKVDSSSSSSESEEKESSQQQQESDNNEEKEEEEINEKSEQSNEEEEEENNNMKVEEEEELNNNSQVSEALSENDKNYSVNIFTKLREIKQIIYLNLEQKEIHYYEKHLIAFVQKKKENEFNIHLFIPQKNLNFDLIENKNLKIEFLFK